MKKLAMSLISMTYLSSTVMALADPLDDLTFRQLNDAGALGVALRGLPESRQQEILRNAHIDPRIVGGESASITEFSYQVALIKGYAPDDVRDQFCGGTLIAADAVLTAAHCLANKVVKSDSSRVDVVAGTSFFENGGERVKVAAIFIHPLYDPTTYDYDVAILRLAAPAVKGKAIPYTKSPIQSGHIAEVSGWGAISEGGRGSKELLFARVPIVDIKVCNDNASYNGQITPRMLCAGERDKGLDACQGDSGGPLVTRKDNRLTLVGIVSWGEGCARKDKYGVYTNVAAIADWVEAYSKPTKLAINE